VLRGVARCCSLLQCLLNASSPYHELNEPHFCVLQRVAVCCAVLQCVVLCCSVSRMSALLITN